MATNRKDIALNEDYTFKKASGDFVIENSDLQNGKIIFESCKGEHRRWPLIGFGAIRYLKQSTLNGDRFKRDLKEQYTYDGYNDADIDLRNGFENLIIDL